jgi:hypothetical protein
VGRPSTYSEQVVETICSRLAEGEPLAVICREEGMPSRTTVWEWERAHEGVSERIARAREAGEEQIAADCLRIADTPLEGVVEKYEPVTIDNPDGPEGPAVTEFRLTERRVEDMLGHRKLQIDTRLKLLAKWNPRKWGDRTTLAGDPDSPIRTEAVVNVTIGK